MTFLRESIYRVAESAIGQGALIRFRRRGCPIFMFHRVLKPGEPCYDREMVTTVPVFKRFLEWAQDQYQIVPLSVLVQRIGDPGLCSITFDDGWEDNYRCAFPLLKQAGLPASIYLITSYIGSYARLWQEGLSRCCSGLEGSRLASKLNEVARQLPWCPWFDATNGNFSTIRKILLKRSSSEAKQFVRLLGECVGASGNHRRSFMDWNEVIEMSKHGITFGSHTVTHMLLTRASIKNVSEELRNSRCEIERRLGTTVEEFAYPWGAINRWVRESVQQAGYQRAVTVSETYAESGNDRFALPRVFLSDTILAQNEIFHQGKISFHLARIRTRHSFKKRTAVSASPLKICLIIDEIENWQAGTEQQFRKIIESLNGPEFRVRLLVVRGTPAIREAQLHYHSDVIADRPRHAIHVFWALLKHLRRERPEIVHTFFPDSNVYGTLAAKLAGVPVIVNARRSLGYWQRWRDRMLLKISNRFADRWQCNSRTVADWLIEHESVPPESIEILPNVIDLMRFQPPAPHERTAVRQRLRIPDSIFVITSVANLRPVKRLDILVRAMATLVSQLPNALALLVGEGECESELRREAERLGVSGNIRFEGRQEDIRPYLAAADIGVLTSSSEGASNSLLECMAFGLPAVVSDIPANRGLVSEVWFAMGDAEDLAKKIVELMRDTKRYQRMRSEYRRSAEEYGTAQFAARVQSFYLSLISESGQH